MELLIWLLSGVAALLGMVLCKFAVGEMEAHVSSISVWIIRLAVRTLPTPQRERYYEEWCAHLEECATPLTELLHSVQCLLGARALSRITPKTGIKVAALASGQIEEWNLPVDQGSLYWILNAIENASQEGTNSELDGIREMRLALESEYSKDQLSPDLDTLRQFASILDRVVRKGNRDQAENTMQVSIGSSDASHD